MIRVAKSVIRETTQEIAVREPKIPAIFSRLFKRALKAEGLIAFFRNCMIHVCPPLTITPEELRDGFGRLRRALSSVDF